MKKITIEVSEKIFKAIKDSLKNSKIPVTPDNIRIHSRDCVYKVFSARKKNRAFQKWKSRKSEASTEQRQAVKRGTGEPGNSNKAL